MESLEPGLCRDIVRRALAEDLGWGDVTTQAAIPPETRATGVLVARSSVVVAGLDAALEAFRQLDPTVTMTADRHDGDLCGPDDRLATVSGLAAPLLTAERTALNFLRHLSGVATLTRQFVDASAGRIQIADTRKTLPLLRALQKYAVRAGGGVNGRLTLDEGVILKANHLHIAGGVRTAVERVRAAHTDLPVQVEIASAIEAIEALDGGAAVIICGASRLDLVREAVRLCAGRARVEVSGTISLDQIAELAATGADFVSIGLLTESASAADITFDLRPV